MTARQFTHEELDHLTNYWCRTLGIHSIDLTKHPQIDDVIILVKVLQEYLKELTASKRIHIYILWDWVYRQKKALTKRQCKQLTRLIHQLENIRHHRKRNQEKLRQKIKSKRTRFTEK
jgi:hypothetical protein